MGLDRRNGAIKKTDLGRLEAAKTQRLKLTFHLVLGSVSENPIIKVIGSIDRRKQLHRSFCLLLIVGRVVGRFLFSWLMSHGHSLPSNGTTGTGHRRRCGNENGA